MWAIRGPFFFIFVFFYKIYLIILTMTGFEPQIGSDCSTNCTTTTALCITYLAILSHSIFECFTVQIPERTGR